MFSVGVADARGQLAGVSTGAQIPMPGPIRRTGRPPTGRCRALQTAGLTGAAGAGRRGDHTYRTTPTRTPSPPPTTSSADSVFRNSFVKALLFRPSRRHLSPGELRVPPPTTQLPTVHPHTSPRQYVLPLLPKVIWPPCRRLRPRRLHAPKTKQNTNRSNLRIYAFPFI